MDFINLSMLAGLAEEIGIIAGLVSGLIAWWGNRKKKESNSLLTLLNELPQNNKEIFNIALRIKERGAANKIKKKLLA